MGKSLGHCASLMYVLMFLTQWRSSSSNTRFIRGGLRLANYRNHSKMYRKNYEAPRFVRYGKVEKPDIHGPGTRRTSVDVHPSDDGGLRRVIETGKKNPARWGQRAGVGVPPRGAAGNLVNLVGGDHAVRR